MIRLDSSYIYEAYVKPSHIDVVGLPAVISFVPYIPDSTTDDIPIPEACRKLEEAGAAVVGINCGRGPRTMVPLLREIRKVCKVFIIIR